MCVACYGSGGNSRTTRGRPALIPLRDRSATHGRRAELTYRTRQEKYQNATEIILLLLLSPGGQIVKLTTRETDCL